MTKTRYIFESVTVGKIKKGDRIRQDYGDIKSFARSIENLGFLICPISVTSDYSLLDGGRRLAAIEFLGWKEIPVIIIVFENVEEKRNEE